MKSRAGYLIQFSFFLATRHQLERVLEMNDSNTYDFKYKSRVNDVVHLKIYPARWSLHCLISESC